MVVDVHAHLYPRAFMEELAADRTKVLGENALRFLGIIAW